MAIPGMMIPPLVMVQLEKSSTFIKNPWLKAPMTVLMTGICLSAATPLGCAVFPQKATIQTSELEPELVKSLEKKYPGQKTFYYNKGL